MLSAVIQAIGSITIKPEVVFKLLSTDGYELYGRSKTLVAATTHPMTGEPDLSGTVRLVLGRDGVDEHGLPALDAMRLMQVTPDWPHRQAGLPDRNTGELSRFVIPRQYRTAAMRAAGVPLVLRPSSEDEVRRIVGLANEHRIALYPFSTGKNWGLGSKLPVIDGCVLVDLSR